ncbi:hypothetical protein KVR01_004545 [Diaporthe batatas]|uniref:uncharacterized protein n=1 Tax=Diaporthe batatas TaxID=748121 RepID=UPI001D03B310|nr:uncharacterized protein KVR01_004545 [Diaporthe batatas]KAG8165993.1 hypothetical protein KVR01_004545 [Diaporthe batatas]
MAATLQSGQGQGHLADKLDKQLKEIFVQLGRIFQARAQYPERLAQIQLNAEKKMAEATNGFHSTLDEMEIDIRRAKAVLMRDLQKLQDQQKAAAPEPAQPPAPMVIDLDPPKVEQASVPVAPMMASVSPFMQNRPTPKMPEAKPVAPFPDMGMGMATPAQATTAVPFHPVKPTTEPKRPSPKPAHKPGPPPARPATKPSPLVTQKQKVPATVPPAAPAVAPPPVPAQQPAPNPPSAHNPFTNATFTLDPGNNEAPMEPAAQDTTMDLTSFDNTASGLDTLGLGGSGSIVSTDSISNNNNNGSSNSNNNHNNNTGGNDTSMDDLDRFFDLGGESNTNFDDNFNSINSMNSMNSMNEFMNDDFAFDTFE